MKNIWAKIVLFFLIISAVAAGYLSYCNKQTPVDNLGSFVAKSDGTAIVSWTDEKTDVVAIVDGSGDVLASYQYKNASGSEMYQIASLAAGDSNIYLLRNTRNAYDASLIEQELMVLHQDGTSLKLIKSFVMTPPESFDYRFMAASGDSVTIIAVDAKQTQAVRQNYEFGTLLSDSLTMKNERTYQLNTQEGIYSAIGCGANLIYISDSGKVYRAQEGEPAKEIYPARDVESLLYASFLSYAESGYVYMGEYETGNIYKLDIQTGEETIALSGSAPFNGFSAYTPHDQIVMDMKNTENFVALVMNAQSESFQLLISGNGVVSAVSQFTFGFGYLVRYFFRYWGIIFASALVIIFVLFLVYKGMTEGVTIMERLVVATIPLLLITMSLFGLISFQYYRSAVDENFQKQVEDEGNMMAALFGQDSFNLIQYPYDYTGDDYKYVSQQMAQRDLYMRAVFYENGSLYLAVDENNPCYYPYEIQMTTSGRDLFKKAALSGECVSGTIRDAMGERVVCITPIGGPSGDVVYLLETGINAANVDAYTSNYLRNFIIITCCFMVIILVLLAGLFYNILAPVGEMRRQMQLFANGDHSVRIALKNNDELSGIAQVFNKMADDINVQFLNLEKLKDTYYRFVPPSIIGLLGKDNLASMTLGSNVSGEYAVMNARITPPANLSIKQMEQLMNRFFNVINRYTKNDDVIMIVDDANLQSIMMVFQNGAESAVITALTILVAIDSENQLHGEQEQMNVKFVVDRTNVYFGICGDEERYIPVVMAAEFEELLENRTFINLLGSRLLITDAAKGDDAKLAGYDNRFIGRLEVGDRKVGMYDIFYDRGVEELRAFKQTKSTFEKAMELYEKGYYYEAKNMFAMVLRENRHDMAARYYVFKCESLQNG